MRTRVRRWRVLRTRPEPLEPGQFPIAMVGVVFAANRDDALAAARIEWGRGRRNRRRGEFSRWLNDSDLYVRSL